MNEFEDRLYDYLYRGQPNLFVDPWNSLQCLGECIRDPACHTWVIKPQNGWCWRKGDNASEPFYHAERNSGLKRCGCYQNNVDVRPGSAYQLPVVVTVEDPGDCQRECALTSGCDYFTVDTFTGNCIFFRNWLAPEIQTFQNDGIIFGPAVCS